jgi:HSP20 family protein
MAEVSKEIEKKESQSPERVERTWSNRTYSPQVDIVEQKEHIVVIADMPGVDENSVDINLEKNVLSIYGRVEEQDFRDYSPVYAEYGIGDYERVFTLSDEIDREKIDATVKNGVLTILLPKAEKARSRKISVKAEA